MTIDQSPMTSNLHLCSSDFDELSRVVYIRGNSSSSRFLRAFASSRSPLFLLLVAVVTLTLCGVLSKSLAAPATSPSNTLDRNTQEMLDELNQTPSAGAPS